MGCKGSRVQISASRPIFSRSSPASLHIARRLLRFVPPAAKLAVSPVKNSITALCVATLGVFSSSAFAQAFSPVVPLPCSSTTGRDSNSPGIFAGLTYAFGSKQGLGFTLQATSSRRDDRGVFAAGVSYYPTTGNVGIPLSLGYQKSRALVLGGYDVLLKAPVLHGGYTNTIKVSNCALGSGISDRRLKHDIRQIAVLDNGLKLYSFKYTFRDGDYVGVMAQDLLAHPAWSNAVIQGADGHYLVNYESLGIRMTTLENWRRHGRNSIRIAL